MAPQRPATLPLFRIRVQLALWLIMILSQLQARGEVRGLSNPSAAVTLEPVVELSFDPPAIQLHQLHDRCRLLVNGRTTSGQVVDLTREARFMPAAADFVLIDRHGTFEARADGTGSVEVQARGLSREINVRVVGCSIPRQFSFERDITPLLSRFGCNSAGCHGKAEGQNGFRLSVFGYDPKADYRALIQESRGRRVFHAAPSRSLLVRKMSGTLPHGGGTRIKEGTPEYEIICAWIAAGTFFGDGTESMLKGIEITPGERVLRLNATQAVRVEAVYADGRKADVTHLAQFQSNNEVVARVDEDGVITTGTVPGQAAIMARYLGATAIGQILIPRPTPLLAAGSSPTRNFIDQFVDQRLRKLNIRPSELATDAEFLRRAHLDIIGTLPTAVEARQFLSDTHPGRRARLVESLLARPEYVDFWALKWADLLRVDRQILGHHDAYSYYGWIRNRLAANVPFDRMVQELISAEGPIEEAPQANFYKLFNKPGDISSTLSQTFLGVRIACAECHHHPFDRWSQNDYYGMQAFFEPVSRRKGLMGEELRSNGKSEAKNPSTGELVRAHPLGAELHDSPAGGDLRRGLAAWFTSPDNPWFTRNLANRFAAHFFGRGLIEPVDDVRATNPPGDPELLDALARHVADVKFDLKQLIRTITDSRTYQLSSHPNETNEQDEQNYSRALFKRMPAEVLLDAVCQTTGVPEKFAGVPSGYRAIQVWDSDVSHYFLRLFGRPVRKTACECERNSEASIAQVLHLLNSPQLHWKIAHDDGTVARLVRSQPDNRALLEELYLTFYSRFPTGEERRKFERYLGANSGPRQEAAEDIGWSMLNSLEFVFNH
ncbi:MAG: DUF1549 domain-containing protein [Pedosphaera sp.]|nr:DUF1549 domain-containing protein [Pedosphaera sp.]